MESRLIKKLRLKEDMNIAILSAPAEYEDRVGHSLPGISVKKTIKGKSDQIHLFVYSKAELENNLAKCSGALIEKGILWVCYPKKSSKITSDIDRDSGWAILSKSKLRTVAFIAIDENYTAFGLKNEPAVANKRKPVNTDNGTSKYIDSKNRKVLLPPQLEALLLKNEKALRHFESLAFSNKKEYVVWILSAKKEETKSARLTKAMEKLLSGRKNPSEK